MERENEKVKEAVDCIRRSLEAIKTDADWRQYLEFQSRFHSYSYGNAMLIYGQNPEATYVNGYKAWNTLGRYVRRGARGIMILAPYFRRDGRNSGKKRQEDGGEEGKREPAGFRAIYVYDIADTGGSDDQLPVLVKGLAGNGAREQETYEKLKQFISGRHEVRETSGTAAKGSYDPATGRICVRADLEYLQKAKTILHEYAHAVDFAMSPGKEAARNLREVVAEGASYVVAQWLGLDTAAYSMGYIKSWLGDVSGLRLAAGGIQKVAGRIIAELSGSPDSAFSGAEEAS